MSSPKAAAFVALMFALGTALDRSSQAALEELPLPWVVATLHFGAGLLWIFPAWVRRENRKTDRRRVVVVVSMRFHLCLLLCVVALAFFPVHNGYCSTT